jgi:hypothetical protein
MKKNDFFTNWHYCSITINEFITEKFTEKFLSNVNIDKETGCWNWKGYKNHDGYGYLSLYKKGNRKQVFAHRVSYVIATGYEFHKNIDMRCLHKCDNPSCINPDHLFLGTQADNVLDMWNKGRENIVFGNNNEKSLNQSKVIDIKRMISEGVPFPNIAKDYNVSENCIKMIAENRTWRHVKTND